MRSEFLPFYHHSISEAAIDEVVDTLRGDWITTGPKTKAFETEFARYIGAPNGQSVMLNSCTAGLHLALAVHGIGPGDEVLLPTLTFAATANVVEHVGARPVFVDVESDTLCIDPAAARNAVTPRTRAILPVHFGGHPADLDAIDAIAREQGLIVIEDAAHALPASYRGTRIGSRDNLCAFSFYATKNITTGEGGALTGPSPLLDRASVMGLHGMSSDAWKRFRPNGSWRYDIAAPGFKYNMTDIQASLGMHQLRELDAFQKRRREIHARYNAAFASISSLQTPVERDGAVSSCHLYVLRFRPELVDLDQDGWIERLRERNIGTSVHFIPLHTMSYYARKYGYRPEDFPVTHDAANRIVSLPLFPRMSDADVEDVIEAVCAIAAEHGA